MRLVSFAGTPESYASDSQGRGPAQDARLGPDVRPNEIGPAHDRRGRTQR